MSESPLVVVHWVISVFACLAGWEALKVTAAVIFRYGPLAPAPHDLKRRYGGWACVVGASSGIGYELATLFAERGINVVLIARRLGRLERLGAELSGRYGVQCAAISCDVSDATPETMKSLAASITSEGREIGILVCNAGISDVSLASA